MLTLAGWPDAEAQRHSRSSPSRPSIAEASWTQVEQRDPGQDLQPDDAWRSWQTCARLRLEPLSGGRATWPGRQRVIVSDNTAFPKIAAIFADTPLRPLKAWQAFTRDRPAAPYLSKRFVDARFEFRNKTLSGQPEQQPRWKRAVRVDRRRPRRGGGPGLCRRLLPAGVQGQDGGAGRQPQDRPPARIENLDWMSAADQGQGAGQAGQLTVKIGYPDKWRDYSDAESAPDDLYGDVERAATFEWDYARWRG